MLSSRTVLAWGASALLPLATYVAPSAAIAQEAATPDKALINRTLDTLHQAASKADGEAYFACFDETAIFMGTDAEERWTLAQFKQYASERFATGKGWTYTPTYRSVYIRPDRTVAWFDELLDNEKYGTCRGSGVMINNGAAWLIVQYNLSVPIPNDLLPKVAEMIHASEEAAAAKAMDAVRAEEAKKGATMPAPASGSAPPAPKP